MDPARQYFSILNRIRDNWDIPNGALGKLSTQTNIEGNHPLGNQNTGFDLYHHTKNCWDPVVVIHRKVANLVLNPF
jgi:hypothetical protein